jgi:hypothetical protein
VETAAPSKAPLNVLLPPLSSRHHVLVAADTFDYRNVGGEVAHYRTRFVIDMS